MKKLRVKHIMCFLLHNISMNIINNTNCSESCNAQFKPHTF